MPTRIDVGIFPSTQEMFQGGGTCYPVQTSAGVWYEVGALQGVPYFRKSTDGGLTFGAPVQIANVGVRQIACWYDKWSGLAGGLIHVVWTNSSNHDVQYRSIDTASADALGTQTTVFAGASSTVADNALSICRTRGGNLMVAFDIDGGAEDGARRSTDVGATWDAATADPSEATTDMWIAAPGYAADAQDMSLYYWDVSADEISVKRFDDSANSWAETSISTGMVEALQANGFPHFAVCPDLANSKNYIIAWNGVDVANQDLKCWSDDGTTITALTDVVTNATDDCALCALGINTVTGALYAFYGGNANGSETWAAFGTEVRLNIYYKVSTDGGATWGAQTQLTNAVAGRRALFASLRSYGFPLVSNVYGLVTSGVFEVSVPLRGPVASFQVGG